jgi:hypothetical protein
MGVEMDKNDEEIIRLRGPLITGPVTNHQRCAYLLVKRRIDGAPITLSDLLDLVASCTVQDKTAPPVKDGANG